MPDSPSFDRLAEPIYLTDAAYFWWTGRRHERARIQRFVHKLRRRAWNRDGISDDAPKRYMHWWQAIESAASEVVNRAQRGDLEIFGDLDGRRVELPSAFLSMTLYADPLHGIVHPEFDETRSGNFAAEDTVYREVTFRYSQIRGLRNVLFTDLDRDTGARHPVTEAPKAFAEAKPNASADGATSKPKQERQKPRVEQAAAIIDKLYPDRYPSRAELPDVELVKLVQNEVSPGRHIPSRDSILRAAKRIK